MSKFKFICIIILFTCLAAACRTKEDGDTLVQKETMQKNSNKADEEISNEIYKKDGIEAEYPRLISGGSKEELEKWNQMIYKDFNKILNIYSFNPFPEPTPLGTVEIPTILLIKYNTKINNDKLISIFYTAAYNSKYSAHPSELVYTTNINKAKNERVKLSDMIEINKDFVKDFRTWDFISVEPDNKELNQAIKDYVNNMSDEDLIMGLQAADIIGSGNLWDIYSYLTPDRLGISLGVPHYAGDHVEFEREYTKVEDFLKPDFKEYIVK